MIKKHLPILFGLFSICTFSQTPKDSLLKANIDVLVEEMEFMYRYDQTMREYLIYKTFDKSESNRIEELPDSLRNMELEKINFASDSLSQFIFKNYINPKDAAHTQRIIDITKEYGFPSVKRIRKYYKKEFADREFNPVILLIHAPRKYWDELKLLMTNEYEQGVISRCDYGYLLWQFTGRKSFQPMLDNGFEMVVENGKPILRSTCD